VQNPVIEKEEEEDQNRETQLYCKQDTKKFL
jgi:hypothetical protein